MSTPAAKSSGGKTGAANARVDEVPHAGRHVADRVPALGEVVGIHERVPVPRRAAHVGREDGDAPGDEGLEEGTVAGTLLRFGAAMEEDDGRPRSGGRRRAIEPARELEAVVGAEALERGARA